MFILLIIIIINFRYNITGIFYVITFILAVINYIFVTIYLIDNSNNLVLRIIHAFCLLTIMYILYLNIYLLFFKINIMSINRITYFHDFFNHDICIFNNPYTRIFNFGNSLDVKHFLKELNEDQIYVVTFEFVYSF